MKTEELRGLIMRHEAGHEESLAKDQLLATLEVALQTALMNEKLAQFSFNGRVLRAQTGIDW